MYKKLPAGLVDIFTICSWVSNDWAKFKRTVFPRPHSPVSSLYRNAEQPKVAMHKDVQWIGDLEIKNFQYKSDCHNRVQDVSCITTVLGVLDLGLKINYSSSGFSRYKRDIYKQAKMENNF